MPALPFLLMVVMLGRSVFPGEQRPTPSGTVWVEMVQAREGKPQEGIGRGVIDAAPERVWRALTDYAHWQEFMPFLKSSNAVIQKDGSVQSSHILEMPAPLGERSYRVRFTQRIEAGANGKVWRIQWSYVPGSGNVVDHRGAWTLTALGPRRTLAVCRLYTELDGAPDWALERGTARMLPWTFHGLRQHVRRSRYEEP